MLMTFGGEVDGWGQVPPLGHEAGPSGHSPTPRRGGFPEQGFLFIFSENVSVSSF